MPRILPRRLRSSLRLGSGRTTTAVALSAAGALVAGMVVAGMGAAGADPNLSDIGAWLASDGKSSISHVNGLTGQVDGRVQLPKNSKSQLQVSEDGKSVLVMDTTTGQVSRIDPAQLTVPQTADFQAGTQVFSGGGKAWLVDAAKGEVQAIDPVALAPLGPPVPVGARPLGTAQADPSGTLWIPVPATGQLVPFTTQPGAPIKVAEPGGAMMLTLASGRPVVTDVVGGRLLVVSGTGIERTVTLPSELTKGKADKLQAPGRSEGPLVPILAADTGVLTLVDIDSGSVSAVPLKLGDHDFGPPQVLGAKVYIPDRTTGSLAVYNTVRNEFEPQLKVTGVPGPLEAYVRDGLLWVNAPNSATAAVVNVQGQIHLIGKFDTNGPKPGSTASGSAAPTPGKSVPEGGVTATGSPSDDAPTGGDPTAGKESPSGEAPSGSASGPPDATAPGADPPAGGDLPGDTGNTGNTGNTGGTGNNGNDNTPSDPGPSRPTERPTFSVPEIPLPTRQPTDPGPGTPNTTPPAATSAPTQPNPPTTPPAQTAQPTQQPTSAKPTTTSPKPTTTSPKPPPMKAPGTPKAQSQPGKIYITVSPASGATPTRYRLGGLGAGMGVSPASIPAKGPFTFTVTGGSCEKEYSFYVIADYPNGTMNSPRSTAVRPCVAAGKPQNLAASAVSGGKVKVTWKPPTNTAGEKVTYTASWTAKRSTSGAALAGDGSGLLTPVDFAGGEAPRLVADPPAVNFPEVADGMDVLAAAAPTKGSATTTSTSITFSVGGGAGSYTFKVKAKNAAGTTSSSTATLTVSLSWGGKVTASLTVPPETPGTAPYPPTPSPGEPGGGGGPVANAAAIVPPRRNGSVPTM
ncbi:hypothetical protein GCM10023205_38950 [Yinghuangia aomiensis]|uniref:Fibronectin type-III domain-containing protein n=1 Tax=Yinghuangia aomiensis TaxID=676205 RepID=A0ABP9HFP6_9ACTN